jgi:hypothetical protein
MSGAIADKQCSVVINVEVARLVFAEDLKVWIKWATGAISTKSTYILIDDFTVPALL